MFLLSLRRSRLNLKRWLRRSTWLQIGLFVLLLAFALHWLSPSSFAQGAQWLLAEMLLFFVPAAMILLDNRQMFGWLGVKLLAVVVGGTVLVMAATALTVEWLFRRSQLHER